jgi:predicted short-subunit dehydrogenase-like oxidoreductase (DUF2520 family)
MRTKNRYTMSIVGAGRVGSTLAVLFSRAGYHIVSVVSQKINSARNLARIVNCQKYSDSLSDIHPTTQIILLAVPEEYISEIADALARNPSLDFQKLAVFHTSGSLTSESLTPLMRKGATAFSLHPIQSFSKASKLDHQLVLMKNVVYGFEGPKTALPLARRFVTALHGKLVQIPKEEKILYHCACVFASNYSMAVLGIVDALANRIDGDINLSHFEPLVRTSIENAFRLTPAAALTGPIVRGSISTLENHVNELRKTDTTLALLYQQIGLRALKMAVKRKSIKPHVAGHIRHIFES